jgi:hypothetical protein
MDGMVSRSVEAKLDAWANDHRPDLADSLIDPKSMRERLESGDVPKPPQGKRPEALGDADPKKH